MLQKLREQQAQQQQQPAGEDEGGAAAASSQAEKLRDEQAQQQPAGENEGGAAAASVEAVIDQLANEKPFGWEPPETVTAECYHCKEESKSTIITSCPVGRAYALNDTLEFQVFNIRKVLLLQKPQL